MDIVPYAYSSHAEFQVFITQFAETAVKSSSLLTGFTTSFLAILVSEVGDKTFFLAMIMATRYSQIIVFIGSYGALFVMTVLSTIFGKVATAWISPVFTNIVVTVLFLYFGIRMLIEARNHQQEEQNEQLKEVEHQLEEMEHKYLERHSNSSGIAQQLIKKQPPSPTKPGQKKKKHNLPNSHVLSQAFLMTFLAQWGDRSQIATIALAASFNPYMVTLGALLGHLICTAAAVKLGQWISGKITQKQILTVGGVVFIISGICTAALVIQNLGDKQ